MSHYCNVVVGLLCLFLLGFSDLTEGAPIRVAVLGGLNADPEENKGMEQLSKRLNVYADAFFPDADLESEFFTWTLFGRQNATDFLTELDPGELLSTTRKVVIGHSLGGSSASEVARELEPKGVDVLVQVDSVTLDAVRRDTQKPDNVTSGYNIYQESTSGDLGLFQAKNVVGSQNINWETFLGEPSSHTEIDNDYRLHNKIVDILRRQLALPVTIDFTRFPAQETFEDGSVFAGKDRAPFIEDNTLIDLQFLRSLGVEFFIDNPGPVVDPNLLLEFRSDLGGILIHDVPLEIGFANLIQSLTLDIIGVQSGISASMEAYNRFGESLGTTFHTHNGAPGTPSPFTFLTPVGTTKVVYNGQLNPSARAFISKLSVTPVSRTAVVPEPYAVEMLLLAGFILLTRKTYLRRHVNSVANRRAN